MGFTLAEAQWLVRFFRNLPGQAAPRGISEEQEYYQAMAMQQQAAYGGYSGYPDEFSEASWNRDEDDQSL
jgi:hypothetical protein